MSRVQAVPLVLIRPCPPVVVHGFEWRDADVLQPIGGPVARRAWSVRTLRDEIIAEGGDAVGFGRSRTPPDYFFAVFPQDQLARMVRLTSAKSVQAGVMPTSPGELVKFFGVLLLSTRFEFGSRAGVVMDISPRSISVHYIRIHFGYEPGTHIRNAL